MLHRGQVEPGCRGGKYFKALFTSQSRASKQQSRSDPQRNEESIQDRYLEILLPSDHSDHSDQRLSECCGKQRVIMRETGTEQEGARESKIGEGPMPTFSIYSSAC